MSYIEIYVIIISRRCRHVVSDLTLLLAAADAAGAGGAGGASTGLGGAALKARHARIFTI